MTDRCSHRRAALDKIIDDYAREVEFDYVCLVQIPAAIARAFNSNSHTELRDESLVVVRGLLERGLRPGDYRREGFMVWNEITIEAILSRIRAAWPAAPHLPTLEFPIRWFAPPVRLH